MLDRGETQDWFSSTEILIEAVVAGLSFYMFIVHTLTAERPFLEPAMFKDRNLSIGLLFIFIVGVVLLATLALLPPFLQTLLGFPVLLTGLVLAPTGIATMAATLIAARLMSRYDARYLLSLGFLITGWSQWETSLFTADVSIELLIYTGVLRGLGLGFLFSPLTTLTFATLSPQYHNYATSMFSLLRNLGSSIGVSVVVFMLAQATQINHETMASGISVFNPIFRVPAVASVFDLNSATGLAALNAEITRQAALIGYLNDFRGLAWLTFVVFPLPFLLRRAPNARTPVR